MAYGDDQIKQKRCKTTPANLPPLSTVSRRILGVASHEFGDAAYCYVNQGYMGPNGIEEETHFRKMKFSWGRLRMRREDNLNNLPMDMLHEMVTSLDLEGSSKDISCLVKDTKVYRTRCADTSLEEIDKLKNATKFHLLYPVRCESVSEKDSSNEACLKEKLCTYLERKTIDYSDGLAPQPRINPIITYVPEDHCYIIYGGIIAARHLPQDKFNKVLRELESNLENVSVESLHGSLEISCKELLEDHTYPTEEIWKFDILREKWVKLHLSPLHMFDCFDESFSERFSEIEGGLLHPKMRKIYYWRLKESLLLEFDHQTINFKKAYFSKRKLVKTHFSTKLDMGHFLGVIDFSNDTLVLGSEGRNIIVICLETYRYKTFKFSRFPTDGFFVLMNNFNKLVIFDRSEPSIYSESGRLDHTEGTNQIDWGSLKRRKINPFLKEVREEVRSKMTPYIPKLL